MELESISKFAQGPTGKRVIELSTGRVPALKVITQLSLTLKR